MGNKLCLKPRVISQTSIDPDPLLEQSLIAALAADPYNERLKGQLLAYHLNQIRSRHNRAVCS
jgi:hypothetical protein